MIGAFAALLVVLGGLSIFTAFRPNRRRASDGRTLNRFVRALTGAGRSRRERITYLSQVMGGILLGILGFAATGAIGLLLAGPALVIGLPIALSKPRDGTDVEVLSALEGWTRSLAALIVSGKELGPTLMASTATVAAPIRSQVTDLAERVGAGVPLRQALDLFGDAINDSLGDEIVGVLKRGADTQGGGVAQRLNELAAKVARDVADRQQVEAARGGTRTSARMISLVMIGITAYFLLAGSSADAVYRQPLGQLVLIVLLSLFGLALVLMRRMMATPAPPRLKPVSSNRTG